MACTRVGWAVVQNLRAVEHAQVITAWHAGDSIASRGGGCGGYGHKIIVAGRATGDNPVVFVIGVVKAGVG